ncbi:hypothetical protein R1sor_014393 [Riccia sorocarpa]|uniref:CCHC-type domain-containing protein n=1 Tax=Riccia sorocarpa TaxID=122646 RepID=A0ABD3HFD8_9MARC
MFYPNVNVENKENVNSSELIVFKAVPGPVDAHVSIWRSNREVLQERRNLVGTRDPQGTRRLSAGPIKKRAKAMGSDLDSLAAQIERNAEESRRLRILLLEKEKSENALRQSQGGNVGTGTDSGQCKTGQHAHVATNQGQTAPTSRPKTRVPTSGEGGQQGNQGFKRSPAEQRARLRELARAARERRDQAWMNATSSVECVKKNIARLNRPKEDEQDPYPELESDLDNSHMSDEIIAAFRVLREANPPPEGKKAIKVVLPSGQLRNRLAFLKDHSFVLYTADITPTLETVENWTKVILVQQMRYNVKTVRPLNKHCFLITVDNEYDRDSILAATPLYLGGNHMVFALPWKATFNPSDITSSKVPVWVELPHIHPGAESFGRFMLQQVGSIVHYDEENQHRHHSVKGCVLLDLQEDLPETIEIEDEETGASYHQKIVYRNIPDACFRCHQRGHIIRNCPLKRLHEQQTGSRVKPNGTEEAPRRTRGQATHEVDADGFTKVKGGRPAGTPAQPKKAMNIFEVLQIEESESDQSEDESEVPKPVTSQVQPDDTAQHMDLERSQSPTPTATHNSH